MSSNTLRPRVCLFISFLTFEASRLQQDYQMTDAKMVEMSQTPVSTTAVPYLERRFGDEKE